ncbi:TylF/MycF family methyltransferase [Salinibacter ruber]|uniref:TylF/MycF family methyltransferase n=1 Tax=Salinibacter ruber TaxID=146919 RepID=UPI002166FB63|nr:TylF/MycF family methyltransferase [Salinibacter ruber]MCS3695709.1 hypothetical protein [Salinibacter ruber]
MSSERKRVLEKAFRYTRNEKVDGDYLEFGVTRGRSLILVARAVDHFASESGASCRLIGFDSFEGFPEPTGVDAIFERFQEGEEYHGGEKVVHHHLRRNRIDRSKVELVNGWYEDTLNEDTAEALELRDARVINIDCDLYNSAVRRLRSCIRFWRMGRFCSLMIGCATGRIQQKGSNVQRESGWGKTMTLNSFPTETMRMSVRHSSLI